MEKLSKEQIELITHAVAKEQAKQHRHRVTVEKDERLRNTKILLREYTKLKAHVDSNPEAYLSSDEYETLTGKQVEEHELAKYHVKTAHLMCFVDNILDAYRAWCLGGSAVERRRWHIVADSWLSGKRLTTTAQGEKWNIDHSLITREQTKAVQDLSVMLFGVAGLEDFLAQWIA